jgi:hypothetical protein
MFSRDPEIGRDGVTRAREAAIKYSFEERHHEAHSTDSLGGNFHVGLSLVTGSAVLGQHAGQHAADGMEQLEQVRLQCQ